MKKLLFVLTLLLPHISHAQTTLHLAATASPGDTICIGESVTFTIKITGGTADHYTWFKNSSNMGSSPTFTIYTCIPNNGDLIHCSADGIDSLGLVFTDANSNTIKIVTAPPVIPTISITGNTMSIPGNTVTLNAVVANAGPSYDVKWMNKGVLFATTSGPTLVYTKGAGMDTITARVVSTSNGCHDTTSTSAVYYVRDITGIDPVTGESTWVSVYPNPAHNILNISATIPIDHLTICNMVGQTISSWSYGGVSAIHQNISSLPPGMYLVQVQCGEERYVSKVVVE